MSRVLASKIKASNVRHVQTCMTSKENKKTIFFFFFLFVLLLLATRPKGFLASAGAEQPSQIRQLVDLRLLVFDKSSTRRKNCVWLSRLIRAENIFKSDASGNCTSKHFSSCQVASVCMAQTASFPSAATRKFTAASSVSTLAQRNPTRRIDSILAISKSKHKQKQQHGPLINERIFLKIFSSFVKFDNNCRACFPTASLVFHRISSHQMSALPPGFEFEKQDDDFEVQHVPVRPQVDAAALKRLMQHRAWQMGKSPIQSIFSSLLMLYFSGNQLSLMSLMLCFMLVTGPIKGECVKTIRLGLRERNKKKKKKKKRFFEFQGIFWTI